jgi:hypothetical protein
MHAKTHRPIAGIFIIFFFILALMAMAPGCSEDEPTPAEPSDVPGNRPTTPQEVLQRFETALELRNFEGYLVLFADDFMAALDTTASDSLDIPEWWWDWRGWGLAEMRERLRKLFDGPDVLGLDLEWNVGEREPPLGPPYGAVVRATDVQFTISQSDTDRVAEVEEWIFHLRGEATTEGDSLWEIAAWEDNGLWLQILDWLDPIR